MNQCQYPLPTADDARLAHVIWDKLAQVAIGGAEYNIPERQPHPKCLEQTRVNLLNDTYGISDDPEKSRLVWLNGIAGVGKSALHSPWPNGING